MEYIVYHGTANNFNEFNIKKTTQNLFWFTDNKEDILNREVGAQGKGYIFKCQITIENPAGWSEYDKLMIMQIENQGFDGIILPGNNESAYVVFSSNQIKILEKEKLSESFINKILKEANK